VEPVTIFVTLAKTLPKIAKVVTPEYDDPDIGGGAGGLAAWAEYQQETLTYEEALAAGLLIPPALRDLYASQVSSTSRGRAPAQATGDKGAPGRSPLPTSSGIGSGPAVALAVAAGVVIVLGGALGAALLYRAKG
jgi:hypothetical protein